MFRYLPCACSWIYMIDKPAFLGIEYANNFRNSRVAEAYCLRPPYPSEMFHILSSLISGRPSAVLDVGCGTGNIARGLVGLVDRIDAVDFSEQMIEKGKRLPNGNHPSLRWILGRAEEAALQPPYALLTAGQSLHWMGWNVVFRRFSEILRPQGCLAIVDLDEESYLWKDSLQKLIKKYSTNPSYYAYDMTGELEKHGLFKRLGERKTGSVPFVQSMEDYIESLHSQSSLTRDQMGEENARNFDNEVRGIVSEFYPTGKLELRVFGTVLWGETMAP